MKLKYNKVVLFSIIAMLIVALGAAGFFGFRTWQEKQIAEKEKDIVNFGSREWIGLPKPTDDEIIENYKNGEYRIVAEEKNPYNNSESIIILSSFLYKKSGEPAQEHQSCGVHAVSECYIISRAGGNAARVVYRTDLADVSSGRFIDLADDKKSPIPLMQFIDAENVIVKSESRSGFSGSVDFLKINTVMKKADALLKFYWSIDEGMPIVSFSKNGKTVVFKDPTCHSLTGTNETVCGKKIGLSARVSVNSDLEYDEPLTAFDGDFKRSVVELNHAMNTYIPIAAGDGADFSFDLKNNIMNGNKIEFQISGKQYAYYFDNANLKNISGWKSFSVKEMGLSFKYPLKYDDVSYDVNVFSSELSSGKALYGGMFENKCFNPPCDRGDYISFGGITSDFRAPRGANYEDNLGYSKKGDAYFMKRLGDGEYPISYPVKEIESANAKGIMLVGNDFQPGPGALSPNMRMAIFNLKNSEFSAVTFVNHDVNATSEKEFEELLETVEID